MSFQVNSTDLKHDTEIKESVATAEEFKNSTAGETDRKLNPEDEEEFKNSRVVQKPYEHSELLQTRKKPRPKCPCFAGFFGFLQPRRKQRDQCLSKAEGSRFLPPLILSPSSDGGSAPVPPPWKETSGYFTEHYGLRPPLILSLSSAEHSGLRLPLILSPSSAEHSGLRLPLILSPSSVRPTIHPQFEDEDEDEDKEIFRTQSMDNFLLMQNPHQSQ